MPTMTVPIEEAGDRLSELVELVRNGNEVVLVKNDEPQAKLIGVPQKSIKRVFGRYRNKIEIAEDFDAPLPDEFWFGQEQ